MYVADVSSGVPIKLNSNGPTRKSRTSKHKMVSIRIPNEGKATAKAKPRTSKRSLVQIKNGGCNRTHSSYTGQVTDRIQGRNPKNVRARPDDIIKLRPCSYNKRGWLEKLTADAVRQQLVKYTIQFLLLQLVLFLYIYKVVKMVDVQKQLSISSWFCCEEQKMKKKKSNWIQQKG